MKKNILVLFVVILVILVASFGLPLWLLGPDVINARPELFGMIAGLAIGLTIRWYLRPSKEKGKS